MTPALDARDQLVDEWLAHVWALHIVAPDVCRAVDRGTQNTVRRRAVDLLRDLDAGLLNRADVLRLVHPLGPPPAGDGWWLTPLGRLLWPGPPRPRASGRIL